MKKDRFPQWEIYSLENIHIYYHKEAYTCVFQMIILTITRNLHSFSRFVGFFQLNSSFRSFGFRLQQCQEPFRFTQYFCADSFMNAVLMSMMCVYVYFHLINITKSPFSVVPSTTLILQKIFNRTTVCFFACLSHFHFYFMRFNVAFLCLIFTERNCLLKFKMTNTITVRPIFSNLVRGH